jgi:hypothetical protein
MVEFDDDKPFLSNTWISREYKNGSIDILISDNKNVWDGERERCRLT